MKKFLFVDLDDTLFQSMEKCGDATDLKPIAFLKDGAPISYSTHKQRELLGMFEQSMTLIPTTARNFDAYNRVKLDFNSYAIINYGGVILSEDGQADLSYLSAKQSQMHLALPGLMDVMQHIDDYGRKVGFTGKARLIEDFGTPFYMVLKDPHKKPEPLAEVEKHVVAPWLASDGKDYYLHRNGNNLAVLPKALNKANAVLHLKAVLSEQHGEILSFGMGDSKSDACFMSQCDYAIIPRATQLAGVALEAL